MQSSPVLSIQVNMVQTRHYKVLFLNIMALNILIYDELYSLQCNGVQLPKFYLQKNHQIICLETEYCGLDKNSLLVIVVC